jgi:hypothetical protein
MALVIFSSRKESQIISSLYQCSSAFDLSINDHPLIIFSNQGESQTIS